MIPITASAVADTAGRLHPIVPERVLRFALRLRLVASPDDILRNRREKLLPEIRAHFVVLAQLVSHHEHLCKAEINMGLPHLSSANFWKTSVRRRDT